MKFEEQIYCKKQDDIKHVKRVERGRRIQDASKKK